MLAASFFASIRETDSAECVVLASTSAVQKAAPGAPPSYFPAPICCVEIIVAVSHADDQRRTHTLPVFHDTLQRLAMGRFHTCQT